jgi:hypothetical protein
MLPRTLPCRLMAEAVYQACAGACRAARTAHHPTVSVACRLDGDRTLLAYFGTRRSVSRVLILVVFMIFSAAGPFPFLFPAAELGHYVDAAAAVAGGSS